jgi:predicted nucleotide-binding protein (sugar kinase/HSP70/actin superfamily)
MDRFLDTERNIVNGDGLLLHPVKHYKRFEEKPFLKKERSTTTILLGGFTSRHDYFIRASMEGLGYKVINLPVPDLDVFHIGREYCNNGMCNPAYFTIGNLLNYLQKLETQGMSKDYIIKNYVFFTVGACGPCRFGMYEAEYRLALRNSGYEEFRVLTFQQIEGFNQPDSDDGLEKNEEFFLGILIGIILADLVNDIGYKIRPYELDKGKTNNILARATEEMFQTIKKKQSSLNDSKIIRLFQKLTRTNSKGLFSLILDEMLSDVYNDALELINDKVSTIGVDYLRQVPIVKITGEFWAQLTEGDGNFKMFEYLENEGAEIIIEPISNWLLYLLYESQQYQTDRFSNKAQRAKMEFFKKNILIKIGEFVLSNKYNKFRKALSLLPQPLSNQYLLENLANKYYNSRAKGGEGHLEVAKSIYYTQNHLSHMVLSLKPFGCLPSTQSDGVHSAVMSHWPEMIFLPIETSAEGQVNAFSRVQMALSDARIKCKKEFEKSLENTKLPVEKIRDFVSQNKQFQSATYKIPKKKNIISKSANFVYHVSELMKNYR